MYSSPVVPSGTGRIRSSSTCKVVSAIAVPIGTDRAPGATASTSCTAANVVASVGP